MDNDDQIAKHNCCNRNSEKFEEVCKYNNYCRTSGEDYEFCLVLRKLYGHHA